MRDTGQVFLTRPSVALQRILLSVIADIGWITPGAICLTVECGHATELISIYACMPVCNLTSVSSQSPAGGPAPPLQFAIWNYTSDPRLWLEP